MKTLKLLTFSTLLASTFSLLSCDKSNPIEDMGTPVVYMPQAVKYPAVQGLLLMKEPQDIVFGAAFGGTNVPTQDINVTFVISKDSVAKYNTKNGTNYELFPENSYQVESMTTSIKKGQLVSDALKVKVFADKFDSKKKYMLPISIQSSDEVLNAKLKTTYYVVDKLLNKYDGVYTVNGTLEDKVVATILGLFPFEIHLLTVDANTVEYWNSSRKDYSHPIISGGAPNIYGSFSPILKFDENGKVVEVTNYYGQPASNGRLAKLDPTGVNKYDPTTKTIDVSFIMNQNGTDRTFFKEKLVYKGKR